MNKESLDWIATSGHFLGALFYYSPSSPQLEAIHQFLKQPDWQQEWQSLNQMDIVHKLQQGLISTDLEAEYQGLFIGPHQLKAAPWGSVYLDPDQVIFGDSLLKLRNFLSYHQVEFVSTQDEPEDHIGLMLMLSAYLAEQNPHILVEFLADHFFTWVNRYLDLLTQQDSVFYQGVALLTQHTLAGWQVQLNLPIKKVQLYR